MTSLIEPQVLYRFKGKVGFFLHGEGSLSIYLYIPQSWPRFWYIVGPQWKFI